LQSSDVLIGGTPAYLESGVFRFKAKWHGRLYDNKLVYGFRHLLLDPANPVCYRFLANISLLALGSDGSFIVLSSKHPDQVKIPACFLADIKSWYVLRTDRPSQSPEAAELPSILRSWYEKVPISKYYAEV
jgi:hypothetical protein